MKLALISHGRPDDPRQFSGIPWHVWRELQRQGHEVTPLYAATPAWAAKLSQLQNLFSLKFSRQPHNPEADSFVLRTRSANIAKEIQNLAPQAVLCVGFPEAALALPANIPLFIWMDAFFPSLRRLYDYYRVYYSDADARRLHALESRVLTRCEKAWLSSDWAAGEARADFPAAGDKIAVQSFGANLPDVPSAAEIQAAIRLRNLQEPRFLFLAQEWIRKGGDTAVETVRQLRDQGCPARLIVVGPREAQPDLAQYPWVEQIGALDKNQPQQAARLREIFLQSAFMLLPSKADCTPIVCHEAAAFGVPVLASNVGGLSSTVDDGQSGRLWPPEQFAGEAVNWLPSVLKNPAGYVEMAETARHRYEKKGNWAVNVRAVAETISATTK